MGWYDFVFDNTYQVDAKEAEERVREKYPLLLHKDERIEFAFKDRGGKGRDKEYLTSHRILIKDGKGVGGKRKNYLSIEYDAIQAFSVESGGSVIDGDAELNIWSLAHPMIQIEFAKSNVDIFQIYQFFNMKINWAKGIAQNNMQEEIDPVPPNMDQKQSTLGNVIDWIGDNAKQISTEDADKMFKTDFPILLQDEKVEIAFRSGRDTTFFTDKRLVIVDVKGITGKKIEFRSILYSSIHGFAVQTAGFWDRDTEMTLYTNMVGEMYEIKQDFRNGKSNLMAIQKLLCNHTLGDDRDPLPDVESYEGKQDEKGGILGLLTGFRFDQRPVDAVALDQVLHSDPPILQGMEKVEMAFQGHRDVTLFTTKRCLIIDTKGLTGKRVKYFSLPWPKVLAFGIRTAGAVIDFDTEVQLYTEMGFFPGTPGSPGDDKTPPTPPIPPRPENSCFELDFNKDKVDLFKLKYYLSRRIMEINKMDLGAPIDLVALTDASPDPAGFERLFQWLGGDQRELDPNELDQEFHTNTKILLDTEKCLMAFKGGRDVTLFTNLRVMVIDTQGLVGCKIEYSSLPYRNICAYAVETAGVWDRDSELKLYTKNRWHMATIEMDFRSGKTDIMQIQRLLSCFIIGLPTDGKIVFGPKNLENHEKNKLGFDSFKAAIFNNSKEVDAEEINSKLHDDIPLLLEEEKVLKAFSQARDMYIFTNRRYIIVDTKGISGQSVRYKTIPYRYMKALEFETSGHMDRDAELYAYTTITQVNSTSIPRSVGLLCTKQSILVKSTDIYEMGQLLAAHTIFGEPPRTDLEEPEIELIF